MDDLLRKESGTKIRFNLGTLFFSVVFILFLAAIVGYGGLLFLNRTYENTKNDFGEQIRIKRQGFNQKQLQEILALDSRLKNTRTVLNQHLFLSNVFQFLEAQTIPEVRFRAFNFSADGNKIDMTGEAPSYAFLARQISIFERNQEIESVNFGGLSFGNNVLNFKISIIFKQSFIQTRP